MTGNLPKLTVIMVMRNAAATVARALDSLAAQRYPELEVIACDGLSTDGTPEILARYGDLVTKLVSESDSGPPDAHNRAITLATGDFVGCLNADDVYEPGMLWAVAEAILSDAQADVVSAGLLYRSGNRVIGYYAGEDQLALTLENTLSELPSFLLSRFIRHELIAKVGPFNTDKNLWYISNDREWMTRLALMPCRNVVVPRALYGYNMHADSLSGSPQAFTRIIDEHLLIGDQLLQRTDLSGAERAIVRRWQLRQLSCGFWRTLVSGHWNNTLTFAREGARSGGWRWYGLTLWLFGVKFCKRAGLLLADGIDRGEFRR